MLEPGVMGTWILALLSIALIVFFRLKGMLSLVNFFFSLLVLVLLNMFLGLPLFITGISVVVCAGKWTTGLIERARDTEIEPIEKDMLFIASGMFLGFLAAIGIGFLTMGLVDYGFIFFIAVIGSLVGAFFRSITTVVDENMSIIMGSAMAMWLFYSLHYWVETPYLLFAVALTLVIGYIVYEARIMDITGVMSGAIMGILVITFTDIRWFMILMVFFTLGGIFTRYKYEYKKSLDIAQIGMRNYSNVLGNGLVALAAAICSKVYNDPIFLVAFLGAVATATADTLATEIGETYKKPAFLITTLEPVPHGTSGGVSMLGELSALLASVCIGIIAILMGMIANSVMMVVVASVLIGGFIATNIDSVLGATLENKGILTNSTVNLFATFFGALIASGTYMLMI